MDKTKLSSPVTPCEYGARWDEFYCGLDQHDDARPLWDVPPEAASVLDYTLFSEHFNSALPLVDLGCGTGRQTAFLANRYPRAIGLDVSARAIELAARCYGRPGLEFSLLSDDPAYFRQLNHRLGDCNVYIRGVLHQIESIDLPFYREALISLMGSRGTLFFVEVADSIRDYLSQSSGSFSRLPGLIKRTLVSHFPPRGFSPASLTEIFPPDQFQLLAAGPTKLNTNIQFPGGDPICIPAIFGLARPLNAPQERSSCD